ncbi:PAS domain-containing hybrid sensor histidine kinase/response regulator [Litorilituus sediminis]|uniref:histidine kinase n=1 Tax=Litorilituus sediminis TaxID=718192 RepID=A0A4P6P9J4_9GAMM|nr:PAS domain-containing hybrid sensor histidine kinase/response regulator [Litorilituus sediminis]QBG36959.1 PAS domain-containing hybrid sensor histidine kinase/response regulator [Litorilituus sediminis]
MFYQATKNTVFRRYNFAVVITFVVIILIALSVASIRYYNELSEHKAQGLAELAQDASQLNAILLKSVQAVNGIQEYAQYLLATPEALPNYSPPLLQDGESFYLSKRNHDVLVQGKRLTGNITGIGKLSQFNELKRSEIAMANALMPAFMSAQKVIEEATWFYYVSYQNFVGLYPWVDRDIWQFNTEMLSNPHNTALKQLTEETNRLLWSPPYLDSAGSGMNASLGKGVFYQGKLLGSIVIDINLARLHRSLPELSKANQGLVLYNQENHILLFKRLGREPLSYRASWQELVPESLNHLSALNLAQLGDSIRLGNWLIEKQALEVNGWTLLKYQSYDDFTQPLINRFLFIFAMLFIGLLAFLMLVNAMTRRTFIKPTTEFIRHIEYCAEGDPGKVKPTADWLHWFQVVEDIFTQNRSLLLQLKEQNDVLDSRVIEKTKALQETSAQHQRDYVLLRSVMNAIPELIVFNDPNGLLIGCNQAFERLTQHQEQDMLGQKAVTFMPRALAKEINYLNASSDDVYPQQALIEAGDYIYQGFCGQFINEQGQVLGTITILRDVTKQQATQKALEKAKNQAEYANQVKIQFLANMSHEVRTPINAMQGMMDLLSHTKLNSRQAHYLHNAQTASVTLLHLVNELLDLSKIEAGKMVISKETVDLAEVVDKAVKLNIANVDSDKVSLEIELAADVPYQVISDEMRLVQVIANLFNNAIKFTEQGFVKLSIDSIASGTDNTLVRFRMLDSGIGIAKEKQGHLFQAFSQADESMTRKYGGSGLGLSICQQIIKLLGGEINLTSELGKGCELSFVLPFKVVAVSNNQQVDKVTLCSALPVLPQTFIDNLPNYNWQLETLSQGEAPSELSDNNTRVLLVNQEQLTEDFYQNLLTDNSIRLLALCQPTMTQLTPKVSELLEALAMPYILLDMPLYRFSLDQLVAKLASKTSAKKISQDTVRESSRDFDSQQAAIEHSEVNKENISSTREVSESSEATLAGVNILLVEDNLVNQLVAKELLIKMAARVTIADNGQSALDILTEDSFDVVLMDIQMPIMDGLTATTKIREQPCFAHLPIIAMTAHARPEDKQRSLAVGMNLHISKPVTEQVLYQSISQVINLADEQS